MKLSSVSTVAVVMVLILLSSQTFSPRISASQSPSHNIGFWLQEQEIENNYTPQAFFNAMFLTSPYPSSADIMTFGPIQDKVSNSGCSASSPNSGGTVSYWNQVASLADSHPNIKLIVDIAFDGTSGGTGTYGIGCFEAIAQALSSHSSIYGIGDEGEYTTGLTSAELQTLCNYVNSLGKQCINYYSSQKGVTEPSNGFEVRLTSFPAQGDQVGTLQLGGSSNVGLASGYYDNFQFPSTFTCPIGPNDVPSISAPLSQQPQGWNQCVVQTELSAAVNFSPAAERQFLELCVGFSGTASKGEPEQWFTGVSGQNTQQLWDNPTLRNWIWTDANYGPNFILSNGAAPPSTSSTTSTTSTTSTSKTSTTSTSTSTTSTPSPVLTVSPSSVPYNPSAKQTLNYGITSGPPGIGYTFTLTTSGGYVHNLATGTVASDGTASGTASDTFDVSSGVFTTRASFANGAVSNAVSIQIGPATTTTTSSTTTSTSVTTSSSLTSSSTTATSTSSTSSLTTTRQIQTSTSTYTSPRNYFLSVVGGCPSTGGGSYGEGTLTLVSFAGVCDRAGNSGLRVTSWSLDGGADVPVATARNVTIQVQMNTPHTVTLNTVAQYALTLDYGAQNTLSSITSPTIPGDGYWYDLGTTVAFTAIEHQNGFTVVGWALDGGAPIPVSNATSFSATFIMSGPHTVIVILAQASSSCGPSACGTAPSYDLIIKTNTNHPSGVWVDGAYYPKSVAFAFRGGSVHNITAADGISQSSTRTRFVHWSGQSQLPTPTLILKVNGSGYLTAIYSNQYLVSLSFVDASNYPITPQSVKLSGPTGTHTLGNNLSAWVEQGATYTIASVTWLNWNVVLANDSAFSVNQPGLLQFQTAVYHQRIGVTDAYGLPLKGALVNVTTLNGEKFAVATDANGLAIFRVPLGQFSAIVSYMGVSNQVTSLSEGSHSYSVSFLLSYPLLGTLIIVSLVAGGFAFLRLRNRKRSDSELYFFSE